MNATTKHVYLAIAEITAAMTKDGIGKSRKNEQQGYKFRGIDDVYNALAPFLASAKLCILPRVLERSVNERVTPKGTTLFYVVLSVEFDLVSAVDGSMHTVKTYGEAMDSGDKATNKAMSAAYKYMAMEVFCIPTEGDNDADAKTHEVKAPEPDASGKKLLDGCGSLEALQDAWKSLTQEQRKTLGAVKDQCKANILKTETVNA
jgi:hypothetical protein